LALVTRLTLHGSVVARLDNPALLAHTRRDRIGARSGRKRPREIRSDCIKAPLSEHGTTALGDDGYREFEKALTDVLCAEKLILAQRPRLAKARAAIDDNDPRYWLALRHRASIIREMA
jgi:hypothetical protein